VPTAGVHKYITICSKLRANKYKKFCLSFSAISRSNRKILSLYWPAVKRQTHVKAKKAREGRRNLSHNPAHKPINITAVIAYH
jgi:hypothetical protein